MSHSLIERLAQPPIQIQLQALTLITVTNTIILQFCSGVPALKPTQCLSAAAPGSQYQRRQRTFWLETGPTREEGFMFAVMPFVLVRNVKHMEFDFGASLPRVLMLSTQSSTTPNHGTHTSQRRLVPQVPGLFLVSTPKIYLSLRVPFSLFLSKATLFESDYLISVKVLLPCNDLVFI